MGSPLLHWWGVHHLRRELVYPLHGATSWWTHDAFGLATMSESERPKPEYGEYASDEEHASALERSGVEPNPLEALAPPSLESTPTPPRRSSLDRIVTVFLLAFGFVSILGSASNYLNLGETLQATMKRIGMGEYHSTELTAGFGVAMLASQVVVWILAAVWSYRRISRHKIAWWVPVLAGVLSFIVLTVLLGSLLAADPSFIASFSQP